MRTVFNILGPLTNPAHAMRCVIGVYSKDLIIPVAKALRGLGVREALVVYGESGLDEVSTLGETHIACLIENHIFKVNVSPQVLGIKNECPRHSRWYAKRQR